MEFRILGPLEVEEGGVRLALGGPLQRLVLAELVLDANRVVSTDRLIDALWGSEPPDTARATLLAYVSRLRGLLGRDRIVARAPGYALVAARAEVDALRFADLVDEARRATSDSESVSRLLARALDLWRGDALSDLGDHEALRPAITNLEELRMTAIEDRMQAEIDVGHHRAAVPELERLATEHPHRERLSGQLMIALYRSGRQSDALGVYHRARHFLDDELGIDPSPELRTLHERMLHQDPTLGLSTRATPSPGSAAGLGSDEIATVDAGEAGRRSETHAAPSRRPRILLAVLAIAASLGAAFFIVRAALPAASPPAVVANAVLVIDPATGTERRVVEVGTGPGAIAFGSGSAWVANFDDRTIQTIAAGAEHAGTPLGGITGNPTCLATADGGIWVGIGFPSGQVVRIDPAAHNAVTTVVERETGIEAVAIGEGAAWITNDQANTLLRIDLADPSQQRRVELPGAGPAGVAVAPGAIWVAERLRGAIVEIDPITLQVKRTIDVLSGAPDQVAYGEGFVWVTNAAADSVLRIDPAPNGQATTIAAVGNGPDGIAAGEGSVWIANGLGRTVTRIDPQQGAVVATITLPPGVRPAGVAVGGGVVWVSLRRG